MHMEQQSLYPHLTATTSTLVRQGQVPQKIMTDRVLTSCSRYLAVESHILETSTSFVVFFITYQLLCQDEQAHSHWATEISSTRANFAASTSTEPTHAMNIWCAVSKSEELVQPCKLPSGRPANSASVRSVHSFTCLRNATIGRRFFDDGIDLRIPYRWLQERRGRQCQ